MLTELLVAADLAAMAICDAALAYGMLKDYRGSGAGGFREYFCKDMKRFSDLILSQPSRKC